VLYAEVDEPVCKYLVLSYSGFILPVLNEEFILATKTASPSGNFIYTQQVQLNHGHTFKKRPYDSELHESQCSERQRSSIMRQAISRLPTSAK
jgi:hypothetical protein